MHLLLDITVWGRGGKNNTEKMQCLATQPCPRAEEKVGSGCQLGSGQGAGRLKGRKRSQAVQEGAAGDGKASLCLGATSRAMWEKGSRAGSARVAALRSLRKTPAGSVAAAAGGRRQGPGPAQGAAGRALPWVAATGSEPVPAQTDQPFCRCHGVCWRC